MTREDTKPVVLMVDDEKEFLSLVGRWASPEFEFVGLTDGSGLLDEVEGLGPDLVILDVRMPGPGGFELCRLLRGDRRFAGLPILFLTGSREDEDFLRNIKAGGTAYLTKPVGRRQLLGMIRELTGVPVAHIDTAAGD